MDVGTAAVPLNSIPGSDQTMVEIPATFARYVSALARAYGSRPAMLCHDRVLTYAELDRLSARRAEGLLRRGVGKGGRVGIRFGNGPEWLISWAAISRIGGVCVPISTFLRPPELARVIRHADLDGLISAASFLERDFADELEAAFFPLAAQTPAQLALEDAPYLRWIVVEGPGDPPTWACSASWLDEDGPRGWPAIRGRAEAEVHPEDEAIIIYTSGQSADPKGVVHTHKSIMAKIAHLREMLGFDHSTRSEATMPFFWVGGLILSLFPALDVGGTVACVDRTRYGNAVIGSSEKQANPFPNMRMPSALGMTETFGIYSWGREWRAADHPITSPLDEFQPGFEVKVVDEAGDEVGDGERGQILVRGPSVAARLHKVDRSDHFDANGFFRTGDEGERDGSRIHFTGRLGDMIKTSGANVAPAEVEREILAVDGVVRTHVVGLPDAERGQIVAAVIVAAPGANLTATDVRAALASRLSSYKVPRKIIFLGSIDEIQMTPTMKLQRTALVEQLLARDEAG